MQFVNLTPHTIRIQNLDGNMVEIPPSGLQARVTTPVAPLCAPVCDIRVEAYISLSTGSLECIEPIKGEDGKVVNKVHPFPAREDSTAFIVSLPCADLCVLAGRSDCFMPGTGPRDGALRTVNGLAPGEGNPLTGATGLVWAVTCLKRVTPVA
jgi:hypothetical protein